MINATFGLGESLVSGKVTPDIYIVDVLKNEIIEYKIGRKEVGVWFGSKGNTEEVRVRNPKVPALRKLEIIHVSEMCKRCEQYFGFPVDIEFAFENSTLYLLQARAITTYFPLYDEYKTTPGKPKHLYLDLIKLSQGFQDSLSELGNEIFTKMVVEVKQGFITEGKEGIMYSVAGREYLDLTNLCSAIGETLLKKTIASYDKPTREILSKIQFSKQYKNEKKPDNIRGVRASLFKTGITAFPLLCSPNINPSSIISDYFEATDLCFIDFDQITEKEVYLDKMVNESLKRFGYLMKRLVALFGAIIAENKIKKIFKNYPVSDEIISLHIDLPGNPTSDMGKQMLHIASNKEFQAVETFEEFQTKLAENSFSRAFIRDYDRYMKLYGCRCVGEIDIATPRIYEQPGLFYQTLKSINIHDNAIDKARDKKRDALIKLSALSKKIGKEKQFIKAYNMLTILGIREHPKYMFVYAIDKIRQKVLNIGTQMLVNRQINNVNDIFMLSISDITRAQKDRSLKMQKIVRENKEKRTLTEHVKDWPVIVDSRGKIYRYTPKETNGKYIGDPVAPGYAKGIAKVLHSPFEKKIQPGDILVVKQTEPSWTPAFINAAGVVMEIGGALQHGAIIAREYGIPCVTGIDGETLFIQDGDVIEVDGSNGTVKKSTT